MRINLSINNHNIVGSAYAGMNRDYIMEYVQKYNLDDYTYNALLKEIQICPDSALPQLFAQIEKKIVNIREQFND